ncbi:aspartyl/asparaginyl beta-hydroxylase domain-containing protein [Salinispora fenicalii]|uniref:aspartyl/asparaginyl beta-hydroxylase domain-containing protein n=1 Tax=Salinispora fenicalii TaxID=1137263 RepID=UPI00165F6734|nr:aspartyl/asparaginyl beta-hydroxylase domain-containing protein [Salinispora fenicalii]
MGATVPGTSACELVIMDGATAPLQNLAAVADRLTRDGIIVADVTADAAETTARQAVAAGLEWAAVLDAGPSARRQVVAGQGLHPDEFGNLLDDHLVVPPGPTCVFVPQNRTDRGRRRLIRRRGRQRLLSLVEQLCIAHGDAIFRVVQGVEVLIGDRAAPRTTTAARPAMFITPGLDTTPWPDVESLPALAEVLNVCRPHTARVHEELTGLVAARPPETYLQHDYIVSKVQLKDPGAWTAIQIYDDGKVTGALPATCLSTRAMLGALGHRISGEAVILRLGPGAALQQHYDENDYQQTLHLGLSIPADAGIRVGGEMRTWRDGQTLVFSPSYLHEAWNHSDQPRDILLIDLWHPDLNSAEIDALTSIRKEIAAIRSEHRARVAAAGPKP